MVHNTRYVFLLSLSTLACAKKIAKPALIGAVTSVCWYRRALRSTFEFAQHQTAEKIPTNRCHIVIVSSPIQ